MHRLTALLLCLVLTSCSISRHTPETKTIYNYVDSLRITDSTVIYEKTIVKDYVMLPDTLIMENNLSISKSYVDTSLNILKGSLEAKDTIKYKYIYKDRIVQKDSLIYKEVPIEVEVIKTKAPSILWWSIGLNVLFLLLLSLKIYLKLN